MTIAKGVTSGYLPLGAAVVSPKVYEAFLGDPESDREFTQVATYGGHPVCSAAALANLEILVSERLWENSETVGAYLLERLKEIDSPFIGEVRGKGLMLAVELDDADGGPLDTARTAAAQARVKEEGVLIGRLSHVLQGPENLLFLSPPLILTKAEADRIVAAIQVGVESLA
jgi:adenosylmethionine-8-amino-7-oxononanoate aminotransferase